MWNKCLNVKWMFKCEMNVWMCWLMFIRVDKNAKWQFKKKIPFLSKCIKVWQTMDEYKKQSIGQLVMAGLPLMYAQVVQPVLFWSRTPDIDCSELVFQSSRRTLEIIDQSIYIYMYIHIYREMLHRVSSRNLRVRCKVNVCSC